jgi:hypothetical protein
VRVRRWQRRVSRREGRRVAFACDSCQNALLGDPVLVWHHASVSAYLFHALNSTLKTRITQFLSRPTHQKSQRARGPCALHTISSGYPRNSVLRISTLYNAPARRDKTLSHPWCNLSTPSSSQPLPVSLVIGAHHHTDELLSTELSSESIGGRVLSVSDEFFAEAFHLIKTEVSLCTW